MKKTVMLFMFMCVHVHAMKWHNIVPCFFKSHKEIDLDEYNQASAADEFKKHVQAKNFAAVLTMLKYDPEACPVDVVKGFCSFPYTFSDCLWTKVMQWYGLPEYYGDDCLSPEKWRELLEALVRHKNINVNEHETVINSNKFYNYTYSPLCLLLFGSDESTRVIRNDCHERILDALELFKQKKVRFSPEQTTYTWGRYISARKTSIFSHVFRMHEEGHGATFAGQKVDLDFLDKVIADLIELGINTTFLCSSHPDNNFDIEEIELIDNYWLLSSDERLKKVFKSACWKRDMKLVYYMCPQDKLKAFDDIHFKFM